MRLLPVWRKWALWQISFDRTVSTASHSSQLGGAVPLRHDTFEGWALEGKTAHAWVCTWMAINPQQHPAPPCQRDIYGNKARTSSHARERCPVSIFPLMRWEPPRWRCLVSRPVIIGWTLECAFEINILRGGILRRQSKDDIQCTAWKAESSVD